MKDGDRKKLSELITTDNKILKLLYILLRI